MNESEIVKIIIDNTPEGKRKIGRPKSRWMGGI